MPKRSEKTALMSGWAGLGSDVLPSLSVARAISIDPGRFRRINYSHIVRPDGFPETASLESGDARLAPNDGKLLSRSRRYRSQLA